LEEWNTGMMFSDKRLLSSKGFSLSYTAIIPSFQNSIIPAAM
jgi:hypothetical protein